MEKLKAPLKNSGKDLTIQKLDSAVSFLIRPGSKDENAIEWVWGLGAYEREDIEITEGSTVIDIGAHIGAFSVYAAERSGSGRVYSYEPHPENFSLLKKNLEINKVKNVIAYDLAISDKKGSSRFFLSESLNLSSLYEKTGAFIPVETISLEEIFKKDI